MEAAAKAAVPKAYGVVRGGRNDVAAVSVDKQRADCILVSLKYYGEHYLSQVWFLLLVECGL